MSDIGARAREFVRLHESGTFVVPNPWDAGTAKSLARLGFSALATTSAGLAFTRGLRFENTPQRSLHASAPECSCMGVAESER